MEAVGRKWRVGVVLGVLAGAVWLGGTLRLAPPAGRPPLAPVEAGPPAGPALALDRLYDLDRLVLEGDPVVRLDVHAPLAPVPAAGTRVPEAPVSALWLLGLAAFSALSVPPRSW